MNVYSPFEHFMYLGLLLEVLRGKRVLVISPTGAERHQRARMLRDLVDGLGIGFRASLPERISFLGDGGEIRFESWSDHHVWMRRGMADYELTHNVDYVLFLDPPEGDHGDLVTVLRSMVERRQGEVVFG